eukprot:11335852-Heterocapsa_arctica.AAC.1
MAGMANLPVPRATATPYHTTPYQSRQSSWSHAEYDPTLSFRATVGRTLPMDQGFPIAFPPRPAGMSLPPAPQGAPPAVP